MGNIFYPMQCNLYQQPIVFALSHGNYVYLYLSGAMYIYMRGKTKPKCSNDFYDRFSMNEINSLVIFRHYINQGKVCFFVVV